MEIYREIAPLQHYINEHKFQGKKIGLVPTMGALHKGHLSLIAACSKENEVTICSIYVNPAQFNNKQDLEKYPRMLEDDIAILQGAGCHAVFCPPDDVMYEKEARVRLGFEGFDQVMEGKYRPGHFSGVGLVVSKLFNIVAPDHAYFGQKDLQQFLIIKQLVKDLSFPIQLRCVPIIREPDGLAMSSRNERLSEEGRSKAVVLYQALQEARNLLLTKTVVSEVEAHAVSIIEGAGVEVEYFEVVDTDTLQHLENILNNKNVAICVAGYIEDIRLIDNIVLNLDF